MNCAATHWFASARIRRASVGANARRCWCRWQFSHSTSLQAKFRYQIYSDARSAAWGESPLMGFEAPTAALAGKKLTLAWVAASAADEAAIAALIPTPAPGQQLDPSQLPRGLSSSISLKPRILVDGEIKAEEGRVRSCLLPSELRCPKPQPTATIPCAMFLIAACAVHISARA